MITETRKTFHRPLNPSSSKREPHGARCKENFMKCAIRCSECSALFHKKCCKDSLPSRDDQDAAADGFIRWFCNSCNAIRQKDSEDTTPSPHLEDATESQNQTIKKNGLSIVQWNAWGIKHKLDELEEFLNRHEIDVCLIQETKLRGSKDRPPMIPGYQIIRSDRVGANGGGLATIVKKNISCEEVKKKTRKEEQRYLRSGSR